MCIRDSKLKGYLTPSVCFKNKSGIISLSNTKNCEILEKYFDQLLNCPNTIQKLELSYIYENLKEGIPPTINKIKEVFKTLKNNKANGEYSISAEHLNDFEEIWKTKKDPSIMEGGLNTYAA